MNEDNGKGYGCFVMLVSAVAIIFSVVALLRHDNWDCEISPAGFVIAALSALITFVVAWQIWTTIATKEEIKKATEAADKLKEVEKELQKQRDFFVTRNLEVRYLIDAHAKLLEAEKTNDLSGKYEAYAEALSLLLKSNVDLSYEQFDKAQVGLMSVLNQFSVITDPIDADNFMSRDEEYEWHYQQIMSQLKKRSDNIDEFMRVLTLIHDNRKKTIKMVQESGMGKRIAQNKTEFRELEKRLRAEEAARQSSKANGDTK